MVSGEQVIAREALTRAQLRLSPVTILAPVVVPREEEGVGDLATEFSGDVDEFDETDDGGLRYRNPRTSYGLSCVRFHDLGLAVNNEPERPLHGHHGQGFEGRVERKTAHGQLHQKSLA